MKNMVKKSLFIIGIIVVVLWFGSNLSLYLYLKKHMGKNIDCVPQKIQLMESKIQAEPIYFKDISFKLPFDREDIEKIIPGFDADQLIGVSIYFRRDKKISSFTLGTYPNFTMKSGETFFAFKQKSNYLRLKDYSWWNLSSNIKLGVALSTKNAGLPSYDDLKIYDVETPGLKGFCYEGTEENARIYSMWTFEYNKDINYNFHFIGLSKDFLNQVREIMANVQLIDDREQAVLRSKESFVNKHKSKYPEELLLLSLISVEGPRGKYIEELVRIMEKKNYEQKYIEELHDIIRQVH